jgi:hypothetical protein
MLSAQAMALSLHVETTPAGDVFPSLELSQSASASESAGGPASGNDLLRVRISKAGASRSVRLVLTTPGLRAPTVITSRIEGEIVVRPKLDWDAAALRRLEGVREQILTVTAESPGQAVLRRELAIRVHPLDEALYFVREGTARIDLGWAFAAWVDPGDPVVDELLDLAGIGVPIDTSLPPDRAGRIRQARAIWTALERRGLRYADETAGISQGPVIYSQRVRLLANTWNDRVANCLDGSVLIASALERLGIGSFLVLVPGHAFVGFYTDAGKREAEFLETTLLGYGEPAQRRPRVESAEQVRRRAEVGFEAARRAGRERYRKVAKRLDGRHRPDYALIDISTARAYGIMPLPAGRGRGVTEPPIALSVPGSLRSTVHHSRE